MSEEQTKGGQEKSDAGKRPFAEYEKKWQETWEREGIYRAKDLHGKKEDKYYGLIEFPYPSGAGLHTGHPRSYTAIDIVTRKRRMEGKNVLYPIGWDAFGLPTENYAIKNKIRPQDATKANIATFTRQLKMLGLGFDWSREVDTTDPAYYKWTQWMFLKFFKSAFDEKEGRAKLIDDSGVVASGVVASAGRRNDATTPDATRMAYKDKTTINWCPSCKIGLANEEAVGGVCERCGTAVEKRIKEQWMIRITKYAERLLKDLDTVDYLEKIKTQQVNWIGRSEGAMIHFEIKIKTDATTPDATTQRLTVFTTRPDTLFGVTYVVLAPEHEFVSKWIADGVITNAKAVEKYREAAAKKTEIERSAEEKEKTGVKLDGVLAVNPANGEEVPVFIADYVIASYGTGAVMAVPAHDTRDFAFAKKYDLPIVYVIEPDIVDEKNPPIAGQKAVERKTVQAIIRNPKTGKILVLNWKEHQWTTFVVGGVEDGEELEDAARREVREETGYTDLKMVRILGGPIRAQYNAAHKKENRIAHATAILFELASDKRENVADEELAKHEVAWLDLSELTRERMACSELPFWLARIKDESNDVFVDAGVMANSGEFTGMPSDSSVGRTCLVVHGIGGYRQENWFPWLKNQLERSGWNVIIPDLPDTDHPTIEGWRNALLAYADQLDERSVVIGHSLGGIAAVDFVQAIGKKIGSLILVAPTSPRNWIDFNKILPDIDAGAVQRFNDGVHADWDRISALARRSVIFYSDNDPYITKEDVDFYRKHLPKIEGRLIPGKFHFSSSQGVREFPELREELLANAGPSGAQAITDWLAERNLGSRTVTYKLRDWVFSRQRYWGEPIPIIICPTCGFVPVPEDQLPVLLPDIESYETTDTGESPLAKIRDWVETTCPQCGGKAERETDTMPNWAGSSWYFLRYCDPKNDRAFADPDKLKYWMPVDLYNGGMEHTTLHLLYSRFWHKVLWDLGFIPKECGSEPYARRRSQGLVLAEGGEKMSKSKGNVVNPDDVVNRYGADVFRVYEMFIGPFEQPVPWDTNGIEGVKRFLDKVWRLFEGSGDKGQGSGKNLETIYHQTVKKVTEDIESLSFNTAVSQFMILTNAFVDAGGVPEEMVDGYLKMLAPFAPHLAEELWHRKHHQSFIGKLLGRETTIHLKSWPVFDPAKAVSASFELVIQVNGKVRDRINVPADISEEDAKAKALASENVKKYLDGKKPKKIIYVKGKLVTIAV